MRYRFDSWQLDWENRELRHGNDLVSVEPKVLHFLYLLLKRHGCLVCRDELSKSLWAGVTVGPDALPRIVKEARKVLGDSGAEPRLILTRRGHGYVFAAQVEVVSDSSHADNMSRSASSSASSTESQGTTSVDQHGLAGSMCIHWLLPHAGETIIEPTRSTTLGRQSTCSNVLEGTEVSRRHAQCHFQGPVAVIKDLGSRNGTYLNGRLVTVAPLADNDVLRIGGWLGIIQRCTTEPAIGFQRLAPGFWGGRELLQALEVTANSAGITNVYGEPGVGKSALAAAVLQRVEHVGAALSLQCRQQVQSREEFIRQLGFDAALSDDSVVSLAAGATLVLDDIDYLDADRGTWLLELLQKLQSQGSKCRRIITTSAVALAESACTRTPPAQLLPLLRGTQLIIPPLRARRSDILGLIATFCGASGRTSQSFSARAAETLLLYAWPRNATELKDFAHRLDSSDPSRTAIHSQDLPPELLLPFDCDSVLQSPYVPPSALVCGSGSSP